MMNMKEEMMNDVMDDAMGDEDDEEESEAVVSKVLDELGLEMGGEMSSIPGIGAVEPGIADKNAPQVKNLSEKIRVVQTQAILFFETNVGKRRIRHRTTLKLNHEFLDRLQID